jgi:hypothetical protein
MFASDDGRVWNGFLCELDDEGGVVGEAGCVRGTGLRVICRRKKGSFGSVSEALREPEASEEGCSVS